MNAVDFIKGKYDPEYKRTELAAKLDKAKASNPKTVTVQVDSDWSIDKAPKAVKSSDVDTSSIIQNNGKFIVQIRHRNQRLYLGTYHTLNDAVQARDKVKAKLLAANDKPNNRDLPKHIYRNKKRYIVQLTTKGRTVTYGSYVTVEEAINRLKELQDAKVHQQ